MHDKNSGYRKFIKKSYKFQNPLHQNYKHSKVLEMVLNDVLALEHIHSVIVFTARSEFKTVMPENVCRGKFWLNYIKGFNQEVISPMKQKRVRYRIEKKYWSHLGKQTDSMLNI